MNIQKTKHQHILITIDKDECTKAFSDIFTFSTFMSEASGNTNRVNSSHSFIVILMIATLSTSIHENYYDGTWEKKVYDKVRSCKHNVLKSYDHHGSKGAFFSFGYKPFYGKGNNNSVGVYTYFKHDINEKKTLMIKQKILGICVQKKYEMG